MSNVFADEYAWRHADRGPDTMAIVRGQRSKQALAYEDFRNVYRECTSEYEFQKRVGDLEAAITKSPELAEVHVLNEALTAIRQRGLAPNDVHTDKVMSNFSVMYRNDEFVGLNAMPEVLTNGEIAGEYYVYNKSDRLAYPSDTVDNTGLSEPNALNQARTKGVFANIERSLIEKVALNTISSQDAPLNELLDAQENVSYGMEWNREVRIVGQVMNAANYATANKITVAAADRFDVGGDPTGVVDTLLRSLWRGNTPTDLVMIVCRPTHDVLKRHPQLLDKVKAGGSPGRPAGLTQMALAEAFEVDKYMVASARHADGTYMWGASGIWIGHVARTPSRRSASFGYSFQTERVKSDTFWMPHEGSSGYYKVRVTRQDDQAVVAADTAGLIITPTG